jgi:hypothetical protein
VRYRHPQRPRNLVTVPTGTVDSVATTVNPSRVAAIFRLLHRHYLKFAHPSRRSQSRTVSASTNCVGDIGARKGAFVRHSMPQYARGPARISPRCIAAICRRSQWPDLSSTQWPKDASATYSVDEFCTLGGRRDSCARQVMTLRPSVKCNLALQPSLRLEVIHLRELWPRISDRVLHFHHWAMLSRPPLIAIPRMNTTIAVGAFPPQTAKLRLERRRGDPVSARRARTAIMHAIYGTCFAMSSSRCSFRMLPCGRIECGTANSRNGKSLLHNVKVRCGIESHDWALASSHVAACRLMSFSTANAVEGETARNIPAQPHWGNRVCSIGKQGCSIATTD